MSRPVENAPFAPVEKCTPLWRGFEYWAIRDPVACAAAPSGYGLRLGSTGDTRCTTRFPIRRGGPLFDALELTHGYLNPIEVDENVGLLAVVGEGMHGTPGLAGRVFSAISKEDVNIIAIAQGSSELTISIVVHRDGLERAIRAVHRECR